MTHSQQVTTAHESCSSSDNSASRPGVSSDRICYDRPTVGLVRRLCETLAAEGIGYCHWKSNNALDRSASGENDLDFLVSRPDIPRFTAILCRLGFKQARAPAEKDLPGVLDFFGYDDPADKLIHVHAHYQLILGHDRTKNHRLPIESAYLGSAIGGDLFKVPAPEFEFIVFVIRMILKHSTWDVMLGGEKRLKSTERAELAYLQARINQDHVYGILERHLPYIDRELFDNCIRALQPGCSTWTCARTGQRLQNRLRANARRPASLDTCLKLWRRAILIVRRRILRKGSAKYRLEGGGAMIAIVGGDGAGKSTAVDGLYAWLSRHFETTCVHLGKPAWSWTTISIRGILKIGNVLGLYPADSSFRKTLAQKSPVSPGYPWLLRELCKARDRHSTYLRARRFAANGGLVILDRFPLSQIKLMDGPQAERFIKELMARPQAKQFMSPHRASALARFLVKRERSYYQQTAKPELLIALRVDPEVAVQRKTDEAAASVRERSTEVWELDWDRTDAHLIDASKSKSDVLAEIKALIWSEL
jgi:thymidylate kinase